MNTTVQSQQHVLKRQVNSSDDTKPEQYNYQKALSTVGMRVRQKIDQGYNIPFNAKNNPSLQSNIKEYAGLIVPQYRQTTAGANFEPPMLVNQRTVSTASSLEMFNDLENDIVCSNGKRRNY
ncbi:hypothetical protein KAFR_0A05560 [Kazachstania africana CBS 2517]|uniref:Uncharacterized protein n=1 Tax=Kazachstania africana (strain ATCC 22294 / BCRC 22015 / CBS 2517 / CECT 1963 / NBRC 1671 / NRRL Y-8276) TaxID=1071382 RepID=H2ANP1_KAZAF|nr:hypothetical protein KAFR_0A05560 [Kazachstania africana CBS 2517]CCF55991.1 hypothetical protein KAFR_0A05560 [Kazachstania africana CBS 2517]